jgi:hypothetical protein
LQQPFRFHIYFSSTTAQQTALYRLYSDAVLRRNDVKAALKVVVVSLGAHNVAAYITAAAATAAAAAGSGGGVSTEVATTAVDENAAAAIADAISCVCDTL